MGLTPTSFTLLCWLSLLSSVVPLSMSDQSGFRNTKLHKKLIVGYADWGQTDASITSAVERGVNVVIWFAIDLGKDSEGLPTILKGPDLSQVATRVAEIKQRGYDVTHLISIGGWNAPHPPDGVGAEAFYTAWKHWNENVVSREGFEEGFDGFDIDLEGNDDPGSPYNSFTAECLDMVGTMCQLAKRDGYIVSLAPAESYLDPTNPKFDLSLRHEYKEWKEVVSFPYHGHNTYAYLVARYGSTQIPSSQCRTKETTHTAEMKAPSLTVHTFDFITVQFYEGYSHLLYNSTKLNQPVSEYLVSVVKQFYEGWVVKFDGCPEVGFGSTHITVQPHHFVVGLGNGWTDNKKFAFIEPDQLLLAYRQLNAMGQGVRGFAFWNIKDEGIVVDGKEVILASELKRIIDSSNDKQ